MEHADARAPAPQARRGAESARRLPHLWEALRGVFLDPASVHPQPLSRARRGRRAAPFLGAITIALALAYLPPAEPATSAFFGALGLTLALVAGGMFVPWSRLPPCVQAAPPLAYLGVVALLRHAEGGSVAPYTVLVLLPIFWFALYGTRLELAAGLAAAALVFLAPVLLLGPPDYPTSEWKRTVIWLFSAGIIGYASQELVRTVRDRASERREQATALYKSKEALEAVIETMSDGLVVADAEGNFTLWNRAAEVLLGHGAHPGGPSDWGEHYGVFGADRTTPVPEAELPLVRAMQGDHVRDVELFIRNANIPYGRWISVSASPLTTPDGSAAGGVAVFHDISERKRAAETSARLASIVESSPDAMFSTSLDGTVLTWNPGAEKLYGYAEDEVIGRSIAATVPPDRLDERQSLLERVANGEQVTEVETVRLRKDGSPVSVSLSVSPTVDDDGRITAASAVVRDVSERKRAERYFATEHAVAQVLAGSASGEDAAALLLEAVAGNMGWGDVGTWWAVEGTRLRCVHTWCAPGLETVMEEFLDACRREELTAGLGLAGRALAERKPVWIGLEEAVRAGYPRVEAARRTGLDGGIAFPLAAGGEIVAVMEFFTSESRQPDRGLVDLMRGISTTIGEFLERKRVEQEAQRLKDEFVSLVSHELRTPLTSILGYVELMRDEELSDEGRRFVSVIERNSARLLSLVGDLLLIAQIEAAKLNLDRSPRSLRRLCEQAVAAAAPAAAAKGVAVELAVRADARVDADPERLGQVLDNLISNGIKFTPAGGRVDVALEREAAVARVTVSDTGAGIPKEEQDRLFERFFRSSTAKREAVPGTGLGLAITKALVEAHGGRITFASDDGAGTTFTVELAVVDPTQEAGT